MRGDWYRVHILVKSQNCVNLQDFFFFKFTIRIHFGNYILNFGIKLFLIWEDNVYTLVC